MKTKQERKAEAYKEYKKVTELARKEYWKVTEPAWKEYEKKCTEIDEEKE